MSKITSFADLAARVKAISEYINTLPPLERERHRVLYCLVSDIIYWLADLGHVKIDGKDN